MSVARISRLIGLQRMTEEDNPLAACVGKIGLAMEDRFMEIEFAAKIGISKTRAEGLVKNVLRCFLTIADDEPCAQKFPVAKSELLFLGGFSLAELPAEVFSEQRRTFDPRIVEVNAVQELSASEIGFAAYHDLGKVDMLSEYYVRMNESSDFVPSVPLQSGPVFGRPHVQFPADCHSLKPRLRVEVTRTETGILLGLRCRKLYPAPKDASNEFEALLEDTIREVYFLIEFAMTNVNPVGKSRRTEREWSENPLVTHRKREVEGLPKFLCGNSFEEHRENYKWRKADEQGPASPYGRQTNRIPDANAQFS